ncbi:hypothetical protein C7N43_22295 [Sphingobacteriales bacterium UPWRP_1]|nr:hypothetical protein B6N25_07510 [Sphingobacteriales bacterium TSM_CSS]PSJ74750.1 hypothetical protein C7N43_22295 [Sphingobacteriales bacterium UPWRP_1]
MVNKTKRKPFQSGKFTIFFECRHIKRGKLTPPKPVATKYNNCPAFVCPIMRNLGTIYKIKRLFCYV